ncbi:MAG TPA: hypothetical protein VGD67_08300 [Pseudonocardiaceae bacterium]
MDNHWRSTAIAVTALIAAGGYSSPPPAPPARPVADIRSAVTETCARFAVAAVSIDATVDADSSAARLRAAREYGTSGLVDQVAGHGTDPTWSLLHEHRARIRATAEPVHDDPPPVLDGSDQPAGVIVTRTAVAENGWQQSLPSLVFYCTVRSTPAGWRISQVNIADTSSS